MVTKTAREVRGKRYRCPIGRDVGSRDALTTALTPSGGLKTADQARLEAAAATHGFRAASVRGLHARVIEL